MTQEQKDRVKVELEELEGRYDKLSSFMQTNAYDSLSDANQFLLNKQLDTMWEYKGILQTRIELNK